MPGASRASAKGLPSESGIIEMRFSSITCPVDPEVVCEHRRFGGDRDGLFDPADVQLQVDADAVADADLDVLAHRPS